MEKQKSKFHPKPKTNEKVLNFIPDIEVQCAKMCQRTLV